MVFGLFNKEKALQKVVARATNPLAQSQDRWAAMEKLQKDGSHQAIVGLCRRFSFTCTKLIEDQQEKDWTVANLSALGESALAPLTEYMKSAKSLGLPLQVLGKVSKGERTLAAIDELLKDEEPGYVRDPKRRIDIIEWLGTWDSDAKEIVQRVLPYVQDFDENVRLKSVETIALRPHPSAADTLCRAILREEEESRRFQVRAAEVLAEQGWSVSEHKEGIKVLLDTVLTGFVLSGDTLKKK